MDRLSSSIMSKKIPGNLITLGTEDIRNPHSPTHLYAMSQTSCAVQRTAPTPFQPRIPHEKRNHSTGYRATERSARRPAVLCRFLRPPDGQPGSQAYMEPKSNHLRS